MHELPPTTESRNLPPLRIHHLLVATAVTAVFMWCAEVLGQQDVMGLSTFIRSGMGVMYSIGTALALTTVAFGIYWRRTRGAFFHQPGHWLLLEQALGVWMVLGILGALIGLAPLVAVLLGVNLAVIVINVWAAVQIADTRLWTLLFLLQGLTMIGMFVLPLTRIQSPIAFAYVILGAQVAVFAVLVGAAVWDRLSRRTRDWPHWLGVFIRVGVYLVALAQQLSGLLAQSVTQDLASR